MDTRRLQALGIPPGDPLRRAVAFVAAQVRAGGDRQEVEALLTAIAADPAAHVDDPGRGPLARSLVAARGGAGANPAPWRRWGRHIDASSIAQMEQACRLPVAVKGALMPDAHVGYGLPIGGVLATENAVVPYAVGVDIACRMKLSVLDIPVADLRRYTERLRSAIDTETRFGVGASFKHRRHHDVLDRDWSVSPITRQFKDKAWSQLGTSGSGNHFVEFGTFATEQSVSGLEPGEYVALLSHSGSRGTGAAVCAHYSSLAKRRHPELSRELANLAWLDLDSEEGREYWDAMTLMGEYAAANHACIHRHITQHLGVDVLLDVENHHNFAWRETHTVDGRPRDLVVHRKGATPAAAGVLGIIPGSMAAPGFLVRGRGHPESLCSAAHGAGRAMSRTAARRTLRWSDARRALEERGIVLMSAGLDEVPMVYKNIQDVMAAQADLVEVVGAFNPKIVKMAPAGERPED